MQENNNMCCEHSACIEKINNTIEEVKEIKSKVDYLEKNINNIDKTLGDRITTLEITYKLGNEATNNKIDKLDRKVDKLIEKDEKQDTTKNNHTFEILKGIGLVVVGIVISYIFKRAGLY
jgi:polyhydroxyalkanoate synthesis regulator phasin